MRFLPVFDRQLLVIILSVTAFLAIASLVGWILSQTAKSDSARSTVANLNARIRAWWIMVAIFLTAISLGPTGSYILFALISFWALREFITLTPTRLADHRSLFWLFFIVLPIHYLLLVYDWYGLFVIFIPVYAFLLLPVRSAAAGDCERFLERTSELQWAAMICIYCVSHAPALLTLQIPDYTGENAKLLIWFVTVVQMNDVLQYIWGKTLGKHPIAPRVSPNKTWEGFLGGTASAVLLGAALHAITPFHPLQAAGMSLVVTLMGFAGGLVMSAIKRDRGIKDFGASIAGHGGILDRIDSLCFAAPIFFHFTRYYFIPDA
jgi:phosphatidate cytidylyltransferase